MESNSINFIIWGVRKGFEKDIIQSFEPPAEITDIINDDIRQICNTTIKDFYSIDRTENYILYTIINPNSTDYVGRKGYIAISLVARKEFVITGDIIAKLKSLTEYYVEKQGSARTLQFSKDMFAAQIAPLSITRRKLVSATKLNNDKGQYTYKDETELTDLFSYISIEPYSKVIFHNGQLELPNYKNIPHFERTFEIKITNYASDRFDIFLNGEKQAPRPSSEVELIVKANDDLKIVDKKAKSEKHLPPKPLINLKDHFYFQTEPLKVYPTENGINKINYKKYGFFALIILVLGALAWYLIFKTDVFKSDETNDQDTLRNDTTQVVNNITTQSTDSLLPDTFIIPKGVSFSELAEDTFHISIKRLQIWNPKIKDISKIKANDKVYYYKDSLERYKINQDQNNNQPNNQNVNNSNPNNNQNNQNSTIKPGCDCNVLFSDLTDLREEKSLETDPDKIINLETRINEKIRVMKNCGCKNY